MCPLFVAAQCFATLQPIFTVITGWKFAGFQSTGPQAPTNAAIDLMCFFSFDCLSRTCENPWRFDHLPCLSFSKSCHLKLENQPSDLNLGSMNYTKDVVFPLVGTAVLPLVDDLGRHWYCGKEGMTSAFEETLRCILVHSCHASCQIKGPTGTNCKKKHGWDLVCARQMFTLCLWFAICEGYIRYSDFPMIFQWFSIIFQFCHEIPVLSAGLPPSIVAYAWNASCQKLEILKKDLDAPEQLHRMWQEVFDEISSKYC